MKRANRQANPSVGKEYKRFRFETFAQSEYAVFDETFIISGFKLEGPKNQSQGASAACARRLHLRADLRERLHSALLLGRADAGRVEDLLGGLRSCGPR